MDATYRADLRELNELDFQRFDAKVEQRFAQFELKLEQRLARLDAKLEQHTASLIRWMFGFWIGTLVPPAGLILALHSV